MRLMRAVIVLVLVATHLVVCTAVTQDGEALLEFKRVLANANGVASPLANWNESDTTPCNWSGITCTAEYLVHTINLTSQGLEGEIGPSLGRLQALEELHLSGNGLRGSIPRELGNCTRLRILYLNENLLSGAIPAELGNLAVLGDLVLAFNDLEGEIPALLAASRSLYIFDVGSNHLSGEIPPELFENPELAGLYINNNNFSGDITAGAFLVALLPLLFALSSTALLVLRTVNRVCPQ